MGNPPSDDFGGFGDEISEEVRGLVKSELRPGERLLWFSLEFPTPPDGEGPPPAPYGFVAVLSVLCVGSIVGAYRNTLEPFSPLLFWFGGVAGFLAVLIVLAIASDWRFRYGHPPLLPLRFYALTDRRAIIWAPVSTSQGLWVYTFPRGKVGGIHRIEFPDGSGNVIFSLQETMVSTGEFGTPKGFMGVNDVRRVEELVRQTLACPVAPAEHSETD